MTPTHPTAARWLAQLSQRQAIYFDQLTRRTPEAADRDSGGVIVKIQGHEPEA